MQTVITQVCQYCDVEYGKKDGLGVTGVSHGVCPKCRKLSDDELEVLAKKKSGARNAAMKRFRDFTK